MKNLILVFLLIMSFNLFGQEEDITYTVDRTLQSTSIDTADIAAPYDSLTYDTVYTYQVTVTSISGGDTTIVKRGEQSEEQFVRQLNKYTAQHFNKAASLQSKSVKIIRKRNIFLRLLNEQGLNNYYQNVRTTVRRQLKGRWLVRSNGITYACKIVTNTGVLRIDGARDTSGEGNNTKIATLIPRSRKYMSIVFEPGFGTDTDIVSEKGLDFVSTSTNVRLKYLK